MNHFSHQPEIRPELAAVRGELALKIEVERIGGVESQTVNLESFDPPRHCFQKMIANGRIFDVLLHQIVIARPSLVMKRLAVWTAAREGEGIPIAVRRRPPLFTNVAKCPEVAPRVMEDRIDHEAHTTPRQPAAASCDLPSHPRSAVY